MSRSLPELQQQAVQRSDEFCARYVKPRRRTDRKAGRGSTDDSPARRAQPKPAFYHPRDHEASQLFQVVRDYFDEFERVYPERYQKGYGYWRAVIGTSIDKFVKCGDLKQGFARVRCPDCRKASRPTAAHAGPRPEAILSVSGGRVSSPRTAECLLTMLWFAIAQAVAFLADFFMLAYLHGQNRGDAINRSCLAFMGFTTLYVVHDAAFFWAPIPEAWVLPFLRTGPLVYGPLPFLLTDFVYRLARRPPDTVHRIAAAIAVLVMVLGAATPLFFHGWFHASWGRAAIPGPLHVVYGASGAAALAYASSVLVRRIRASDDPVLSRAYTTVLTGIGVLVGVAVCTNVVLPNLLSRLETVPLASSSSTFLAVGLYLAVRRYNFLSANAAAVEKAFRSLFDTIECGVVMLDEEHDIVHANAAAHEILHCGDHGIAHTVRRLMTSYDPVRQSGPQELRVCAEHRDKTVLLTRATVRDPALRPLHIVVVQDITQLKLAQRELSEQRRKWESLVYSIPDTVLVVDRHGTIRFANHGILLAAEDLIDRSAYAFLDAPSADEARQAVGTVLADGESRTILVRSSPELPPERFYDIHIGAIPDDDGVVGVTILAADATERVHAEAQLRTLNEELEAVVAERTRALDESRGQLLQSEKMRAVGQLAGGIAHDFNNQLAGILACADFLRLRLQDESVLQGYADTIVSAARRAADLTSQLLAFARKGPVHPAPVDVHATVAEVVSLITHSIDRRIQITRQLQACRPTGVCAPGPLQNAILNLALNAAAAMPHGGELTFRSRNESLDSPRAAAVADWLEGGEYVVLDVVDTGVGIEPEVQQRVFEPFFSTKDTGKNLGMGLAVVYGTMRNHGGAVAVRSQPGKGSVFSLYLRATDEAPRQPAAEPAGSALAGAEPLRVLVVDDEYVVRFTATRLLEQMNHTVWACATGEEALERYERDWVATDVVLLDLVLPGMDGRQVLREMLRVNPAARVVLCSGYAGDTQLEDAAAEGAVGVLRKPYLIEDLKLAITNARR